MVGDEWPPHRAKFLDQVIGPPQHWAACARKNESDRQNRRWADGYRGDIARAVIEGAEAGRRDAPRPSAVPRHPEYGVDQGLRPNRAADQVQHRLTGSVTPSLSLDNHCTSPKCTPSCPSCNCDSNWVCAPCLDKYGMHGEQAAESIPKLSTRWQRR